MTSNDKVVTIITRKLANGESAQFPSTFTDVQVQRIVDDMNARSARIPVMQDGRKVGTLPRDFNPDPRFIESRSFLYDPRPGDITRVGETWVAGRMLGYGDLDAIKGFMRDYGER